MLRSSTISLVAATAAILSLSSMAAAATPNNQLRSRAWTLRHLGPNGLEKCRAFRTVVNNTMQLQKAGGGRISPVERKRLDAELSAAKAMPPRRLTPFTCGVPL